ncbi:MAG TPA: transporter [Rikenellaceae bacterium]|nr:MAG: transporter [Bacteroidetes bacterium GWE2_40_15]HBZ25687.1 transporter [Rikenellaceae bacterium]
MKRIILSIGLLAIALTTTAQGDYNYILSRIEANSTTLQSLREQMEAQKLGNRTGIFLSDPEVEFAYLWGNTPVNGERTDFKITQSFDFPTVYGHRDRVAKLENSNLELLYKAERLSLLLHAKQICIELVYYNALTGEVAQRLSNAERIAAAYRAKLEKGEANIIENNKTQMNVISLQNEASGIETERTILLSELKRLNGGQEIVFEQNSYPGGLLPDNFDEWYSSVVSKNPALLYANSQITIGQEKIRLNRAQGLPKFSAGYMSEQLLGERFQGVTVGLSIPLWNNKNRVRQAQAQLTANQSVLADSKVAFYTRLQGLYDKAVKLKQSALKYRVALSSFNNEHLLKRAFDAGEISLLNYLTEIEYYYEALRRALETEKNFELSLAELSAMDL